MGTPKNSTDKRKRYTKPEKIKILQYLESVNFDMNKTGKKYGITVTTIVKWRTVYGSEAFGIKPRADIAVKKRNQIELLEISNLQLQTLKANAAAKAAQVILERLNDPERIALIPTETLIKVAALYKEEAPVDAPREIDMIRQRMEQFDKKRQAAKEEATDTPYTIVDEEQR
jgi:hypothetical protein